MVVDDAAIGADGHIDAGLLEVFVASLCNLDGSRSLAAADALGLARDADGAAADADLHEVRARLCQKAEALAVDDVAGTDLHGVAVVLAHPLNRHLLPIGIALGRVDAQHVGARLDQRRNALGVVAGVDACAHHVSLMGVEHLVGVRFVGIVVLAEHHIGERVVVVHERQRIQLVIPDDIVSNLEGGVRRRHNQLLARGHELGNLLIAAHAGKAIIALGNHAKQLTVRRAVVGNRHRGVVGGLLQGDDLVKRHVGRKVGVGLDEPSLVVLHALDHGGFLLDGLVAVDEGKAALGGKCYGHVVVRDGGHDSGHHRNVQRKRALLFALAILDERRFQADRRRNARSRRVARHQKILVERA